MIDNRSHSHQIDPAEPKPWRRRSWSGDQTRKPGSRLIAEQGSRNMRLEPATGFEFAAPAPAWGFGDWKPGTPPTGQCAAARSTQVETTITAG